MSVPFRAEPLPPPAVIPISETLKATDLVKRFGEVTAVAGVSLSVKAGEVVGLLGPNGAGKTTTLRMLAGILSPSEGDVQIAGIDLRAQPVAAKRRMGFLSGDTQLYRRLTPVEMLRYFGRLYEIEEVRLEKRIQELIQQLEITGFAGRQCGVLSSGEKQRANIARAFLHEPDLLILDEPTTALDVVSGQFIIEAIRNERAAGRAVLFSTHIMGEAEYLCDRIYLMHHGCIVDHGRLDDLVARSGCANLTDAFLQRIRAADAGPAAARTATSATSACGDDVTRATPRDATPGRPS